MSIERSNSVQAPAFKVGDKVEFAGDEFRVVSIHANAETGGFALLVDNAGNHCGAAVDELHEVDADPSGTFRSTFARLNFTVAALTGNLRAIA